MFSMVGDVRYPMHNAHLFRQKYNFKDIEIHGHLVYSPQKSQNSQNILKCVFHKNSIFADAPLCVTDKVVIVGAFRNENLHIYCEVQADPPPRYVWNARTHFRVQFIMIFRFWFLSNVICAPRFSDPRKCHHTFLELMSPRHILDFTANTPPCTCTQLIPLVNSKWSQSNETFRWIWKHFTNMVFPSVCFHAHNW